MYRYALSIAFLAVVSGLWYVGVEGLLSARVAQAQADIKRLHDQERMIQQSAIDIARLDKSITDLQAQFVGLSKKAVTADFQSAVMMLINQAGSTGLAMQACAVVECKDENWYTRNALSLDVSGNYDQLLKFVQGLLNSNHLIAMHHATMSRLATDNKFNLRCGIDVVVIK